MQKMVCVFVIVAIFLLPSFTSAQDARARVEEILSSFPASLYSNIEYYDIEAIHAAKSFDDYNEHYGWARTEERELNPLPKELSRSVSTLAKAVRVRFRVSGFKEDPKRGSVPEILLDENGNYTRDPAVTAEMFMMFGDKGVAIVIFGRIFRVYRIIALDELIKKAVKNGSMVQEEGSILGVPFYRIESNPAEVPYLCCSVEPDVLLLAEDESMLEELVAVSTGGEASLATEEFYDEVIFLGPELGPRWSISNSMMSTHPSIVRRLTKFGIPEEALNEQFEKYRDQTHFFVSAYILGNEILEREMDVCGTEEGAEKALDFRESRPRYGIDDDAPEPCKRFNNAYNAARKFRRDGTIVYADLTWDKELLELDTASDQAWDEVREKLKKEKEAAAKEKDNAEQK